MLFCSAAYAGSGLRALDLPGEPPGAGAMGPDQGEVVFPDGPINTPFNRGGDYGMSGYGASPGPFGLFGPPESAGRALPAIEIGPALSRSQTRLCAVVLATVGGTPGRSAA